MKICIFTNHFFPEDFKVNDIAFELQKKGFDITVFTAIPDYPKGRFFDGYSLFKKRKETVNGVKVYRLPIIPRGNGGALRLILNYISYFVCLYCFTFFHKFTHKYNAIFVHETSPFFVGLSAVHLKKNQKIPLYFWVLDLWPESLTSAAGITQSFVIDPQVRMVKYVYNNCNKILIGSKGFANSICEKGDYKAKLVYFPNWAESIVNIDKININGISPFNNFSDKDFIILFAGNIGKAQNLDIILKVAKKLNSQKRIKFVFIGDGREKQTLQTTVEEENLNDTVYFIGQYPLNTMPLFMKKASTLLVSLKDEPCFNVTVPAKVQFYMSQAKPILAVLNGDGADLIKEANCGFNIPANDEITLYNTILKVSNISLEELDKLGKNGRQFYNKNFGKEQRIEQLIKILNRDFFNL